MLNFLKLLTCAILCTFSIRNPSQTEFDPAYVALSETFFDTHIRTDSGLLLMNLPCGDDNTDAIVNVPINFSTSSNASIISAVFQVYGFIIDEDTCPMHPKCYAVYGTIQEDVSNFLKSFHTTDSKISINCNGAMHFDIEMKRNLTDYSGALLSESVSASQLQMIENVSKEGVKTYLQELLTPFFNNRTFEYKTENHNTNNSAFHQDDFFMLAFKSDDLR